MQAMSFHLSGATMLYDSYNVRIILILFSQETDGNEFAVGVLALLTLTKVLLQTESIVGKRGLLVISAACLGWCEVRNG